MKKGRFIAALTNYFLAFLIGLGLFISFPGVTFAHTPYLMVADNEDGTFDVTGGYSNGQSAAGTLILLKSKETGEILWQGRMDEYGELLSVPKQKQPCVIIFDGGLGHTLEKDSLCLTKEEIEILKSPKEIKRAQNDKTREGIADIKFPITPETEYAKKSGIFKVTPATKLYPLDDDFEYVKDILPEPLMVHDPNGVIRAIPIMQGYRYHHGKGLEKIMEKLEAKRGKGAKVEFKINDVPLCFGITSGYLSLKFAINELYGKDIPKADDFKIMLEGKMCSGVWDMYSLYFGEKRENKNVADKELTFIAERPSKGEKIVFVYNTQDFPQINKLFLAKRNPGKFQNVDLKSLKRDIIKKLLSTDDFSYFKVISKD